MARGRCGRLRLHRMELSSTTPCRLVRRTGNRVNEGRSGPAPEPRQGALPPGPPPEAEPLDSIRFGWVMGRGVRARRRCRPARRTAPAPRPHPPPHHPIKVKGSKGSALGGDPRGRALVGSGAKPRLSFVHPIALLGVPVLGPAHAGCDHAGTAVREQRDHIDTRRDAGWPGGDGVIPPIAPQMPPPSRQSPPRPPVPSPAAPGACRRRSPRRGPPASPAAPRRRSC